MAAWNKAVGDGRVRSRPVITLPRRHLINRLPPAAGKSISLRQGVTGRSSITIAAERLCKHHHYVKYDVINKTGNT